MRTHHTYQSLLSRGRKAGLTTRELNSALQTQPVTGGELHPGQADCNGYIPGINAHGHRTLRPPSESSRS